MFKYVQNPYGPGELPRQGGHGWLLVALDAGGQIALPEFLKVKVTRTEKGREYFDIMEGPHQGKKASVSMKLVKGPCFLFGLYCKDDTYVSRLSKTNPHEAAAIVTYQKVASVTDPTFGVTENSKISIGRMRGGRIVNSYTDVVSVHSFDLMPPGTYEIGIPDYEHVEFGQGYVTSSPYATTWFPINAPLLLDDPGTPKNERGLFNRYLHAGRVSLGCLSVEPSRSWTDVARFIGRGRLHSGYVGYLEVLAPT